MEIDSSKFYFGQAYDLTEGKVIPDKLTFYDPEDLVTHGVIVGMTGSGKTGLGIILLEEAALQGIPAILIDPKGDLTNHLLHFPDLQADDFAPWIDEDAAKRDGQTVQEAATAAASNWAKGLERSGIDKARMEKLSTNVDYVVYSPGSTSAFPISILSSLRAPKLDWEENKEMLRENISSTVTALLGLVGFKNIDPIRSREHILLSNIFEHNWSQGADLNLESLILQVQNPPFDKLGVFAMTKFYPEKDRFELAMLLNNFIAAPSFENWLKGQALDIGSILYAPDGKPRHSVFYLAHLSDQERMFFVTLLYTAIETWMRSQAGTTNLRALVYFDEIAGYLPPVANPPSKPIILRMLKMARAFGVGLVLSTQNPIDLDYKALSNAGTWMIGRLQTEQDKARLLDGLDSIAGGYDRAYFDKAITALGKRVFLLHNVHAKAPEVFTTRWAMNYLPGPITREKLEDLNRLVGADLAILHASMQAGEEGSASPVSFAEPGTPATLNTEPKLPSSVDLAYLPINVNPGAAYDQAMRQNVAHGEQPSFHYEALLMGQATVYYANRTHNIDTQQKIAVRLRDLQGRGLVRWEDYTTEAIDLHAVDSTPLSNATFGSLSYPVDDEKTINELKKDFVEWIYRNAPVTVYRNETLKLSSRVDESLEDFKARCEEASQGDKEALRKKITDDYAKKKSAAENRLMKEEMKLEKLEETLKGRRLEEGATGLTTALSWLGSFNKTVGKVIGGRRKSITSSLTKRRLTASAKKAVEESELMVERYKEELEAVDEQMQAELDALQDKHSEMQGEIREIAINPLKKDIVVEFFGLAWEPQYAYKAGDRIVMVPANEV